MASRRSEILAEEGFGRLLRRPEPEASISPATPGRDTNLPRAAVLDFDAWPARLDTTRAGPVAEFWHPTGRRESPMLGLPRLG